jgi:hypothetical protein
MQRNVTPHLESTSSIGSIALREQLVPNPPFHFVDVMYQILLAREVLLRIDRDPDFAKNRFGLTDRLVYDMIIAVLWHRNLELHGLDFNAPESTRRFQFEGMIHVIEELKWPFGHEITTKAKELANLSPDDLKVGIRTWDWMNGLLVPGCFFSLGVLGAAYELSATLRVHLPDKVVKLRYGVAGLVFPHRSYWTTRNPVAKVLAPLDGVKHLAGWVGPCKAPENMTDTDFGRLVEIHAAPPPFPPLETRYSHPAAPDEEWDEAVPPLASGEAAALTALRLQEYRDPARGDDMAPKYEAKVEFALRGEPQLFLLRTNALFVTPPPCGRGEHRIPRSRRAAYKIAHLELPDLGYATPEAGAVTVVNAAGTPANEAFARAWCCHVGKNAVVWKRDGGCCFKCGLMLASKEGMDLGVVIVCG